GRDDFSVDTVFADQQICGSPYVAIEIIPVRCYAASFRIEVVAAEKGCLAFQVTLGHQQDRLLLANLQLASAHVVARRFAFTERLTDFFCEARFGPVKICVDHNRETNGHTYTLWEHLRNRKSSNRLV